VRLAAMLARARLPMGVDVNFGDPIWPEPSEIDLPRLVDIGLQPVRLLGYPPPMVIAEKTVTILQRGQTNTRWRDFADIHRISIAHELAAGDLRAACGTVATLGAITPRALLPGLEAKPLTAQPAVRLPASPDGARMAP